MEKLVKTIPKTAREEIRVSLTEYKGHDLCDLRVYAEPYAGDEGCPRTRGGIAGGAVRHGKTV